MRAAAPAMLTPEEAARRHPAPAITDSKIRRLRLLAADQNPKIRQAAASSLHAPIDLYGTLSRDADADVRAVVARNESTPCDVLRELARDDSETVRAWVATNFFAPADVMELLADDRSETVRGLVSWKTRLAREAVAV